MKKLHPFSIGPSQKAALGIVGLIGLLLVWQFAIVSSPADREAVKMLTDLAKEESNTNAFVSTPSKIPDGPRFAVVKGSHGYTDRSAALEFSNEFERVAGLGENEFNDAISALNSRHEKEGRRITFKRDCILRLLTDEPPIGRIHRAFVEGSSPSKSYVWIERKFLMDQTSALGSRILTGSYILRGDESVEFGGVLVSNLKEMLSALYDGRISEEQAKLCAFTLEAQCSPRVEYVANDYAICAVMGGQMQPFAVEIDGSESAILSGRPIRFVEKESFTTQNGTVRIIPRFKSFPLVEPTPFLLDDSDLEAGEPD